MEIRIFDTLVYGGDPENVTPCSLVDIQTLKIETAGSSEISINIYPTTRCHIPVHTNILMLISINILTFRTTVIQIFLSHDYSNRNIHW
jgi:hypothetical protein